MLASTLPSAPPIHLITPGTRQEVEVAVTAGFKAPAPRGWATYFIPLMEKAVRDAVPLYAVTEYDEVFNLLDEKVREEHGGRHPLEPEDDDDAR